MADNKLVGQNYIDARPRREGHGQGEVRRRLPRRRHAVREAAVQPDAARAREAHRHERGARDARRQGDPDGRRSARARPTSSPTSVQTIKANPQRRAALTNEPLYHGEPILAVAAVDELTAAEAIEKIQIEFEPLPFVVDPLVSLRPGGPNARTEGNVWGRPPPARAGRRPRRAAAAGRGRGAEVDRGGLRRSTTRASCRWASRRRVDVRRCRGRASRTPRSCSTRPSSTPNTSHQTLEPRTAMAYWQNGKLYMHAGTQSTVQTVASHRALDAASSRRTSSSSASTPAAASAARRPASVDVVIPALLSKKANAPVMMRITRDEEHYIGGARPALHGRVKVGFAKDGRITALDLFVIADNGPYDRRRRRAVGGRASCRCSISRRRCGGARVTVLTNTPPRARAEPAGRHAGHHADGADPRQGGAQARHRSGRHPPDQRAGGQGAVRRRPTRAASAPTRRARS